MLVDDEVFVITKTVGLVIPDDFKVEEGLASLQEFFLIFFNACRFASKQYNLPRFIAGFGRFNVEKLPDLTFPRKGHQEVSLNTYNFREALSWRHLARANEILESGGVPVFHDLLLDAFQSFLRRDYKHAILYAAIAVESMALEVMESAYQRLKTEESAGACWRFIELNAAGGGKVRKDPIYEHLRARDDFSLLLHERPLYLWQRSLLVEDQELYRVARELYKTRNKIVHRGGGATIEGSTLRENEDGAETALKCAVEIFQWFGVESDYVFPRLGFIHGRSCELPGELDGSP